VPGVHYCGLTQRNDHGSWEIRDNLAARIIEAKREGWLG
jgi:hypothetical protein